jgi:hypothetical protein
MILATHACCAEQCRTDVVCGFSATSDKHLKFSWPANTCLADLLLHIVKEPVTSLRGCPAAAAARGHVFVSARWAVDV